MKNSKIIYYTSFIWLFLIGYILNELLMFKVNPTIITANWVLYTIYPWILCIIIARRSKSKYKFDYLLTVIHSVVYIFVMTAFQCKGFSVVEQPIFIRFVKELIDLFSDVYIIIFLLPIIIFTLVFSWKKLRLKK